MKESELDKSESSQREHREHCTWGSASGSMHAQRGACAQRASASWRVHACVRDSDRPGQTVCHEYRFPTVGILEMLGRMRPDITNIQTSGIRYS